MTTHTFVADTEGAANRFDGEWHVVEYQSDETGEYYTACGERVTETFAQVIRGADPRDQFRDSSVEKQETMCPDCESLLQN